MNAMSAAFLAFLVLCMLSLLMASFWSRTGRAEESSPVSADMVKDVHVVSAHWNEDVSWLAHFPSYSVCDKIPNPRYAGTGDCDVIVNHGRECSAYLTYILRHYEDLPCRVCFVHGHRTAPHQRMDIIDAVVAAAPQTGYVTLNGQLDWKRHEEWKRAVTSLQRHFPRFWSQTQHLFRLDGSASTQADASAQFCVDKELILRIPKSCWQTLFDELMEVDDYHGCMVLELCWHLLFDQQQNQPNPCDTYVGSKTAAGRAACEETLD